MSAKAGKSHIYKAPPAPNPEKQSRRAAGERQFQDPKLHHRDVRWDPRRKRLVTGARQPSSVR